MKRRTYKLIASTVFGEVRQYPGSLGYQVWVEGKFFAFTDLKTAMKWIS